MKKYCKKYLSGLALELKVSLQNENSSYINVMQRICDENKVDILRVGMLLASLIITGKNSIDTADDTLSELSDFVNKHVKEF